MPLGVQSVERKGTPVATIMRYKKKKQEGEEFGKKLGITLIRQLEGILYKVYLWST